MSDRTVLISVSGMSCGHCTGAVEKALREISGVSGAEADLAAGTAKVTYDPTVADLPELIEAIERAGYAASVAVAT